MTTEQIIKIVLAGGEDARFHDWNKGRTPELRFVYLREYQTIWKFTPQEWWCFVNRTIRNDGVYDLPLSKANRLALGQVLKCNGLRGYSSDKTVRCVDPLDWTIQDWKNELA